MMNGTTVTECNYRWAVQHIGEAVEHLLHPRPGSTDAVGRLLAQVDEEDCAAILAHTLPTFVLRAFVEGGASVTIQLPPPGGCLTIAKAQAAHDA